MLAIQKTAYNSSFAKVAVQCSADTFVVNQTLVPRINICGKNRHLRQAANRCHAPSFPEKKASPAIEADRTNSPLREPGSFRLGK